MTDIFHFHGVQLSPLANPGDKGLLNVESTVHELRLRTIPQQTSLRTVLKTRTSTPCDNRLLAALPKASQQRFLAKSRRVTLRVKDVLWHPGDSITAVYFPLTCVISMMTEMKNGATIEIATVGNEGVFGIAAYLGINVAVSRGITQVSGEALQVNVDDFVQVVSGDECLDLLLRRYTHALLTQIARSGGCNSLHSVEERYARWLLMMHDRTNVDVFAFTQEFLSGMLGVSRARVNIVSGLLEKAGLVRHSRNRITVLDWPRLEASSCDCYHVMKEEFARIDSSHRLLTRQRSAHAE